MIKDLMSTDIPTQLRAFMLATARAELVRVIQLTEALSQLEDTYIQRALEDKDSMDMKSLSNTITTIMNSLNRSVALIDRITHDDSLQVIIDQSTKLISNTTNNVSILADQQSREKLRNVTTKLLSALDAPTTTLAGASNLTPDIVEVQSNGD